MNLINKQKAQEIVVKLFILFFLLISIIKVHGEHFKIAVFQEGSTEKNQLTLVKGRYSKIFIKFISDSDIAVSGTYKQTWKYIEKDKNSLQRHSNMHLIFE